MHKSQRQANLLGAIALATVDRIRASTAASAPNAGEGPAGLVAIASFLQGGSIAELSRIIELSHSATVRLVDKLEREGLVKRRGGSDARAVAVVATGKGVKIASSIQGARMQALDELLEPLSNGERAELARLHAKVLAGLASSGARRGTICRLCDSQACGHDTGQCPVTEAPALEAKAR